ncbi:hypothetical protein swp_4888 [Shewanella piezotolerans WP3]|uniref:Uncharacterized protein n=2 Tax=Shewanella TaxID=22 RepID=B8CV33_SHEPW|nr:hypothetical protein swp_4888 [Shewanella piezotolerans WP3]
MVIHMDVNNMNNKIAVGIIAIALAGIVLFSLEQTKNPLLTSTTKPAKISASQPSVEINATEEVASIQPQLDHLQNQQVEQIEEVANVESKPLPPPYGSAQQKPSPANGQGVVSHPSSRAPVQAPISQASPRKE